MSVVDWQLYDVDLIEKKNRLIEEKWNLIKWTWLATQKL